MLYRVLTVAGDPHLSAELAGGRVLWKLWHTVSVKRMRKLLSPEELLWEVGPHTCGSIIREAASAPLHRCKRSEILGTSTALTAAPFLGRWLEHSQPISINQPVSMF